MSQAAQRQGPCQGELGQSHQRVARGLSVQAHFCLTLDKVRVVGLVGRENRCHLVVVCRVDVFVNAIPGQFYL